MTSVKLTGLPRPAPGDWWGLKKSGPAEVARYRSVYLLGTGEDNYVVKPLRVGAGQAWLTGKLLSIANLCPVLPVLVPGGSGGGYRWHRGNRYLITRRIFGREADYRNGDDLGAAIEAMAHFHRFTGKIVAAGEPGWRLLEFHPENAWRQAVAELEICRNLAVRAGDKWSKQYLQLWSYFWSQANLARRKFAAWPAPAEKVICYHDWAYHNVLLSDGRAYLIDFDAMVIDEAVHDRANLAGRYLRLHDWSRRALFQLLRQFDRLYPWHRDELTRMRIYLTFPYDYWMIGRQYYLEKQPWSARCFQDQWQRKIVPYQARGEILELLERM